MILYLCCVSVYVRVCVPVYVCLWSPHIEYESLCSIQPYARSHLPAIDTMMHVLPIQTHLASSFSLVSRRDSLFHRLQLDLTLVKLNLKRVFNFVNFFGAFAVFFLFLACSEQASMRPQVSRIIRVMRLGLRQTHIGYLRLMQITHAAITRV
jgi:hypothetical protein